MSVTEGMDAARIHLIAGRLQRSSEQLGELGTRGRGQLSVLHGAWAGPDLEDFGREWGAAERSLQAAGQTLSMLSTRLRAEAGEQDDTSSSTGSVLGGGGLPTGPGPGGPGGPSGPEGVPWLENLSTWVGRVGALDGVNDIIRALNAGRGLGALLSGIPALTRPILSPAARLGLYLQAELTHPLFGRGAAALFGSSRLAPLFNSSRLAALSRGFGRLLGPLSVGVGAYDLVQGVREGDWSQAISGGLGIASVAAPLLIASGPVGWAVAGGLAIGSFVVSQWGDDIAAGAQQAWDWTGDRLSDIGDSAQSFVEDAGSVLSSGLNTIGGLFS
ncbi:DUF4646 domain-containing protein [Janibacter terrae]|uniref:DUF4646 domain-containing protein n=1 Tax=Janibacter terrae TaxID=103817 RepID=A0ABZ2FEJ9_9MICO|nr:hypothetical protein [Kytococcus sp.]HCE60947.1 hypothetical protein [Janibacter terrae]